MAVIKYSNGFKLDEDTTITLIPPKPTEEMRGGIIAKAKVDESVEVVVDTNTGKAYVPAYPDAINNEQLENRLTDYDADIKNFMVDNYNYITIDGYITAYSSNPVTSEAIYNALESQRNDLEDEVKNYLGNMARINYVRMEALPEIENADTGVIYLIMDEVNTNVYYQYMLLNGEFANLGTTSVQLDNYVTKHELDNVVCFEEDDESAIEYSADYLISKNLRLTYDANYIYLMYGARVLSRIPMPKGNTTGGGTIDCTGISFTTTSDSLTGIGNSKRILTYTLEPEGCVDLVTFVSSNPDVATISDEGLITAVSDGECRITAICGDFSAYYNLTIIDLTICKVCSIIDDKITLVYSNNQKDYVPSITIEPVGCTASKQWEVTSLIDTNSSGSGKVTVCNLTNADTGRIEFIKDGEAELKLTCGMLSDKVNVRAIITPGVQVSHNGNATYTSTSLYPLANSARYLLQDINGYVKALQDGDSVTIKLKDYSATGFKFGVMCYQMTIEDWANNDYFAYSSGCAHYPGQKIIDAGWCTTGEMTISFSGDVFSNVLKNGVSRTYTIANGYVPTYSIAFAFNTGASSQTFEGATTTFSAAIAKIPEYVEIKKNGVLVYGTDSSTWEV